MAKIQGDAFEFMAALVREWDTPEHRDMYRQGKYPRADRTKDVNMRYRWDIFWAANSTCRTRHGHTIHDTLPDDVNDAHVDTALRRIVAPL